MGRLTLGEMRRRSKDFFFAKGNNKFHEVTRTSSRFDKKSGQNFIKVASRGNKISWYKFNPVTGKTSYASPKNLPANFR